MRFFLPSVAALAFVLPLPALASSADDLVPDATSLSQLEEKAQKANPRERSFLYTELAHIYTIMAGKQIAAGDMEHAATSLKRVQGFTEQVHSGLARDSKKLKDAEMLMQETSHHMGQYLHAVSSEDREMVQAALKHVDQVNEELLAQVFAH